MPSIFRLGAAGRPSRSRQPAVTRGRLLIPGQHRGSSRSWSACRLIQVTQELGRAGRVREVTSPPSTVAGTVSANGHRRPVDAVAPAPKGRVRGHDVAAPTADTCWYLARIGARWFLRRYRPPSDPSVAPHAHEHRPRSGQHRRRFADKHPLGRSISRYHLHHGGGRAGSDVACTRQRQPDSLVHDGFHRHDAHGLGNL
jgi:hypothetical protein